MHQPLSVIPSQVCLEDTINKILPFPQSYHLPLSPPPDMIVLMPGVFHRQPA